MKFFLLRKHFLYAYNSSQAGFGYTNEAGGVVQWERV